MNEPAKLTKLEHISGIQGLGQAMLVGAHG